LSIVLSNLDDNKKAKEGYLNALKTKMRILGEDNEEYSKTLGNLSNMFLKLGY
jgi:hypothetical protein